MQCLILAGGLGTRMRPRTDNMPKAMLEVAGRPFAHHQLALLASQGIDRVVYSIGHHGHILRDYVGDGSAWGLSVAYVDEGPVLRGTAGAIRLAVDRGGMDEGFFVLYGDSYLPTAMKPVWRASCEGKKPLMTILRNDNAWDQSNVRYGDGQPLLYDKKIADPLAAGMNYIDYGLSVMNQALVRRCIPSGQTMDLADVFHALSVVGLLEGYEVTQRFYEIGSPAGHAACEAFLQTHPTPPA